MSSRRRVTQEVSNKQGQSRTTRARGKRGVWSQILQHTLFDCDWPPDSVVFGFLDTVREEARRIQSRSLPRSPVAYAVVLPATPPNIFHIHLWQKLKELYEVGIRTHLIFNDISVDLAFRDRFSCDAATHAACLNRLLSGDVSVTRASDLLNVPLTRQYVERGMEVLASGVRPQEVLRVEIALLASHSAAMDDGAFLLSAEMDWHTYRPAISYGMESGLLPCEPVPLYLPLLPWRGAPPIRLGDDEHAVATKMSRQIESLNASRGMQTAFCLDLYRYFFMRGETRTKVFREFQKDIGITADVKGSVKVMGKRWLNFVDRLKTDLPAGTCVAAAREGSAL